MNKFKALLKATLINSLSINKLLKKYKKKSLFAIGLLITVIVLAITGFSFIYMLLFGSIFNEAGHPELILLLAITVGSILCLFTTVFRANSFLFRTKDFDLLISMPINPSSIFITKLLSLALSNYAFMFIIYFPCLAVYAIFAQTTFMFWCLAIVMYLFIPIVPLVLGSFIAYVLGFIRIPRKLKNILSIALSLSFIIFVMSYSFGFGSSGQTDAEFVAGFEKTLISIYYLGNIAFLGIQGNLIYCLAFAGGASILMCLFVIIVSKTFLKANSANRRIDAAKKFEVSEISKTKQTSVVKALAKKELKVYFGIPGYVMNTIVGPFLSLIFVFTSLINNDMPEEGAELLSAIYPIVFLAIICICCTMTTATAVAISLEGKSLWILKSAPVKAMDVFKGKMFVNLLITIPFIIVDCILVVAFGQLNIFVALAVLIIGCLYALFAAIVGLIVNIYCPKFEYDNPIKVVKNSKSVLITLLITALTSLILIAGAFAFSAVFGLVFAIVYAVIVVTVFLVIAIAILCTKGVKKYTAINA